MTARTIRRRETLSLPGVRSARYARSTKTLVFVCDGEAQGLDTEDGRYPWYTVCDDHGGICAHETFTEARAWASVPQEWCPTCQDERDSIAQQLRDDNSIKAVTA